MNLCYYVLIPAGRLAQLLKSQPKYGGSFGYLIPGHVDISDHGTPAAYLDKVAANNYEYSDLAYAVTNVDTRESNA